MKSTNYLYDCEPTDLPSMEEGLTARTVKAKLLLNRLQTVQLVNRDMLRIKDVLEAIDNNKELLSREV